MRFPDKSGTDRAKCSRKVVSGRRVAGAIRSIANARELQLECTRVLHETLIVPFLKYGSEVRMLWKEKENSRIKAVQMDNLTELPDIRRIDKVPNARSCVE